MEKYSEWVLAVCGAVILVLTYFPEAIQSLNPERKQLAEFHFISNPLDVEFKQVASCSGNRHDRVDREKFEFALRQLVLPQRQTKIRLTDATHCTNSCAP